ncbi:GtrA family protein [Candidatus Saccharibacteria bacterium]|nr:GtrA family protein [Candidatus Saccharibacteria bacterium]MBQ6375617.1 GtrA family protein [Candidatus Saccharibacteria bacterium]
MKFRVGKFAIVGGLLSLFNFLIYTALARVIMNTNELLWLDSIIAYVLTTILAFIMHSKITWQERSITRHGIAMFFLWNGITGIIITPILTAFFGLITPFYQFAYHISSTMSLPFDYDFIESTSIFVLTTAVTMVLNYFFYDKIVFDNTYFAKIIKKLKSKFKKPTKSQVFACLLYLLPIIFAFTTAFLITTSGEDIHQGAGNLTNGTAIDVATDAANAFNFNSRLTDMYAWSVIDFYDYQYQFGPDTIFRLIDVAMITAVFYFATYLILNRKPRLQIKDALIFCACFSVFIITPFGRAFYHEFSMIHNYVPLALITLLFSIPYLNLVHHLKSPKAATAAAPLFFSTHPIVGAIILLILGVAFGMSATITPLAFLATVILFCLIRRKSLVRPPLWFYSGLIGCITGFLVCWLAGSGVDHYASTSTAATFDYIAPSDIFTNLPRLIYHELYNFGITLAPLFGIFLLCLIFLNRPKALLSKVHLTHLSPATVNILLIFALFIIIHILGASLIKSPPRLLIPAYLAGIILIFRLFAPHLKFHAPLTSVIVIFTTSIVIIHTIFLLKYRSEMSLVLDQIKNSTKTTLCISPDSTRPTRIPVLDLAEANMLVDWGYPEPIYGKEIVSCE